LFELIETTPQDDFKMVPFLLGKAYEQSQYQLSAKEDLIRGVILMLETDIKYPNAKSAGDWTPILNAPFEDVALAGDGQRIWNITVMGSLWPLPSIRSRIPS